MDKRPSLEVIAQSIEEAIAQGLENLGLSNDDVEIEVLDPGSRGLFGLGSRQARVRLTVKSQQALDFDVESIKLEETPIDEPLVLTEFEDQVEEAYQELEAGSAKNHKEYTLSQDDIELDVAEEVVSELLAKMKIVAQVEAHYGEPDDAQSRIPLQVDLYGQDLSILIGPRAETLNALQYIAGLIIGKELGKSVPLVIDVEGYRARRLQQIRQLATTMADQAIKTGRRQVLEPMPANERRLVHIALRDHPDVTTESVGEEPHRKVGIIPKQ